MVRYLSILIFLFILSCSSDGGSSSPTAPSITYPPVASSVILSTSEDQAVIFPFQATDPSGLPLTFLIDTQPSNGNVVISGSSGTYTPNTDFNGKDLFYYKATSTNGTSLKAKVEISVLALDDDPSSGNVSVTIDEDTSIDITLPLIEVDGDNVQFTIVSQPANGTVSLSGNTATYSPNPNFYGGDSFQFDVNDLNRSIDASTASITINPVNDKPIVSDINGLKINDGNSLEISLTGEDIEGDNLSYSINDSPSSGSVSIDGSVATFIPSEYNTSVSFTYKAYDGTDYSDIGTVNIDIGYKNISFGDNNTDLGRSIVQASDGGFLIAGYNIINQDDGSVALVKTDANGVLEWIKNLDNRRNEGAYAVIEHSSGGYVTAGWSTINSRSDFYIVKTDVQGNIEWEKRIGNQNKDESDIAYSLIELSSGDMMVTGMTRSNGSGSMLVKIAQNGDILPFSDGNDWHYYGGEKDEFAFDIVEASNGDIFTVGFQTSAYQSDDRLWETKFVGVVNDNTIDSEVSEIINYSINDDRAFALCESLSNNGIVMVGYANNQNMLVLHLDNSLQTVNSLDLGVGILYDIQQTTDQEYIVVGKHVSSNGSDNVYIAKLSSNLSIVWEKSFGGNLNDGAYSVVSLTDGYAIAGYTNSFVNFNQKSDIFLLKVDLSGNRIF
jgi:hypothetical protein